MRDLQRLIYLGLDFCVKDASMSADDAARYTMSGECCFTLVYLLLLVRVALVAQRPVVIKLSRERSVGRSVGLFVVLSVSLSSALWKNGRSDPDAVWYHRSDGSRDEAGSAVWGLVHGQGYFWGDFWALHCNQWVLYGVRVLQRRDAALFPNYFGQSC